MQIVNSQIHLWENARMSPQHRQIPTYNVDDALKEMAEAGVDAAVIHPPSTLGEGPNAQAVEAVRPHPDKFCILGNFDLQSPEPRGDRQELAAAAGHARLPLYVQSAAPAELVVGRLARLVLGGLRARKAARRADGRRAAWPISARIAERHPGLKLHIDHHGRGGGGGSGTDDAAFADLGDMLALAKYPNVAVKLSGAPSYSSEPYPYRNIHKYIRQIFDAFGAQRCFWGTDITRMPCSYRQCVTMFTEELPWLQGRDKELVMGDAVCDWLGWKRPV